MDNENSLLDAIASITERLSCSSLQLASFRNRKIGLKIKGLNHRFLYKRGLEAPEFWQILVMILALLVILFVLMWFGALGDSAKSYLENFLDIF